MKLKLAELRKKTNPELQRRLKRNREKLRNLRFDLAMERLKNHREIRRIKKEISRILTLLNQ